MIIREVQIERHWFGWLCGLLEGEGTFVPGSPAKPRRPTMAIGMVDEDVIERVCTFWGSRLYRMGHRNLQHKPVFRTELVGGSAVALMKLMRYWMSERRQAQIDKAIESYRPLRTVKHKQYELLPNGAGLIQPYWHAGYLEGEAAFTHNRGVPMVEVNTIDRDVIERVRHIWWSRYDAYPNIHTRPPRQEGHQPQYHIACYGAAARALMADVLPLMGQRRTARITELLALPQRSAREEAAWYDGAGGITEEDPEWRA
jgi:hypothetical protein